MTRIAFVGYSYGVDPRLLGGHQSILRRLAGFLTDHGHEVDYVVYGDPGSDAQQLGPATRLLTFPGFGHAARHLARGRYDYVQMSYLPARNYPAAVRYLAWQRRQPARPKLGYLYVVWPPRAAMRLARIAMFRLFYDKVVAVSPRLQQQLDRYRIPSFLMLPPVPDPFFEPVPRSADRHRIAYIGRIDADKGVGRVLETLRTLVSRHPSVQAEIAGYVYPHSVASMELHQKLLSQDVIHYEGGSYRDFQPGMEARVLGRLHRTDLLLLPYEHLSGITVDVPLLLLEAMASGCAVLTTGVADIPEIVADPKLITDGAEGMSAAASALIEGGELSVVGERLRQRAESMGVRLSATGARYAAELGLS